MAKSNLGVQFVSPRKLPFSSPLNHGCTETQKSKRRDVPAVFLLCLMSVPCLFLSFSRTHWGQCYLLSVTFPFLLGSLSQPDCVHHPLCIQGAPGQREQSTLSLWGHSPHWIFRVQLMSVFVSGATDNLSHLAHFLVRHRYAVALVAGSGKDMSCLFPSPDFNDE